jgi:hypothetical protein
LRRPFFHRDFSPALLQDCLVKVLRPLLQGIPFLRELGLQQARLVGLGHTGFRRDGMVEDPVHNLGIDPNLCHACCDSPSNVPYFELDSRPLLKTGRCSASAAHRRFRHLVVGLDGNT